MAINGTAELDGTLLPSGAGSMIKDAQWGIDATLSGYIIQDVTITTDAVVDQTQDQKGAVVSELVYDKHWNMSMTVIGGSVEDPDGLGYATGDTLTWDSKKWTVRSVEYRGNYASKKMYTITADRYVNFPAAS